MPVSDARAPYALGARSLLLLVPVDDKADVQPGVADPFSRAHALAAALTHALGAGPSRCRLLLPGRHTAVAITDAILEAGRHASTLIVYVAGQLGIDSDDRLTLSGPSTEGGAHNRRTAPAGLPWPSLAAAVGAAGSPQRLLLADLHANRRAWQRLDRQPGAASLLLKPSGTAVVGHVAPPTEGIDVHGGFTDLVTAMLSRGDPTGPPILTIGNLATRLRAVWPRGGSPRLTLFDPDTTRITFRNHAAPRLPRYRAPGPAPIGPGPVERRGRLLATSA